MAHRLLFILSFFAIVITFALLHFYFTLLREHKKWKERIKNAPKDRALRSKKDFVDFYLKLGYENVAIDFVYDRTQKILKATGVTLLHTDDIINFYERSAEEWLFILNKWLKELGRTEIEEVDFKVDSDSLNFEYLIRTIQSRK